MNGHPITIVELYIEMTVELIVELYVELSSAELYVELSTVELFVVGVPETLIGSSCSSENDS